MASNATVDDLWENYHEFKLWYGVLVACGVVVLLTCSFISITVAGMRCRWKESVRYVYQTKPMKRRNGSEFSVRSQGILELQSPHPNYNFALEEGATSIGRSREQLSTDQQPLHVRETSASAEDGYQQLDAVTGGDVVYDEVDNSIARGLGNFSRQGVGRQSVRSESGRNIHFARQSTSRASIRSESGITRVDREERFSRHKPTSMSTRSAIGARKLHRGNTDPLISILTASPSEGMTDGRLGNSSTSLPQISIHQVRTPKQEASTPAFNSSMSQLSDNIPGFRDPELLGGGDSDSLERLRIDLPPDIYSSQILHTVKSPEWEDMNAGDEEGETAFRIITETSKSTRVDLNPGGSDCSGGDPDARMMLVVSSVHKDEGEGFYDLPLLNRGTGDNLEALFDDPGYKRGFAGQIGFVAKSNAHVYHTLEPPSEWGVVPDPRMTSSMGRKTQMVKYENVTLGKEMAGELEMEVSDNSFGRDTQVPEPGNTRVARYENVILGEQMAGKSEIEMSLDSDRIPTTERPDHGKQGAIKSETECSDEDLRISAMEGAKAVRKGAGGYENVILDKQVASKSETEDSDRDLRISAMEGAKAVKGGEEGEEIGKQVASKSAMKGSVDSFALLDFEDDELLELDPDIAACLVETERGVD